MLGADRLLSASLQAIRLALHGLTIAAVVVWLLCSGRRVKAEFETVIDSPPTTLNPVSWIDSNTQINLYPGGVLPRTTRFGPTSGYWLGSTVENIEINLLGGAIGNEDDGFYITIISNRQFPRNTALNLLSGTVWGSARVHENSQIILHNAQVSGELAVAHDSLISISGGGVAGDVKASTRSLLQMSGGTVQRAARVSEGSLAIISGGEIGEELSLSEGSLARMSGGTIGGIFGNYFEGVTAVRGSRFLMSGGKVQGSLNVSDSFAEVTGGTIEWTVVAGPYSHVDISGGTHGAIRSSYNSNVKLAGGEFRLDGVPIEGLGVFSQEIDFPEGSLLTGLLADGTPLIVANQIGYLHDEILEDRISLRFSTPPPTGETRYATLNGNIPLSGLREGESFELSNGATLPANFAALPGSTLLIEGGVVEHGFQAAGATIELATGSIGEKSMIYHGTTMRVTGGEVGSNFEIGPGSRLEMSGGTIREAFRAHSGSEVLYSGGKFSPSAFWTELGSQFTIVGDEFRLDGVPLEIASTGAVHPFEIPAKAVLSGTLADGTAFTFGNWFSGFAEGTLRLQATEIPDAEPALIRLPTDPAPQGLRTGQTLMMADGAELGDFFTAGWDSTVQMSGGRIGHQFQAVGSFVNVTGGEIESLDVMHSSVINLAGGRVASWARVGHSAILNISAGAIDGTAHVFDGGIMNVSGGSVRRTITVSNESQVRMTGGVISDASLLGSSLKIEGGEVDGEVYLNGGSRIEIRGGKLADGFTVDEGSHAMLYGREFRIDGEPFLFDLFSLGVLDISEGAVLSGVFSDGTPFAFTSYERDHFAPGTLRVSTTLLPFIPGLGDISPQGLSPGQELTLKTSETLGRNFTAGWDSTLHLTGGEIGDNFEAVGATVNVINGTIGEGMDVLFGSMLNMSGGKIGRELEVHRGGVAKISGGELDKVAVRAGGELHLTGGEIGTVLDRGTIYLEAESELHITGRNFLIDGQRIDGLEPGDSVVFDWETLTSNSRSLSLEAALLYGSPLKVDLEKSAYYSASSWQDFGPRMIVLTSVWPGDFDNNRLVEGNDFLTWQRDQPNWTIALWRETYGTQVAPTTSSTVVPEPAAFLLISVFCLSLGVRQRSVGRVY